MMYKNVKVGQKIVMQIVRMGSKSTAFGAVFQNCTKLLARKAINFHKIWRTHTCFPRPLPPPPFIRTLVKCQIAASANFTEED